MKEFIEPRVGEIILIGKRKFKIINITAFGIEIKKGSKKVHINYFTFTLVDSIWRMNEELEAEEKVKEERRERGNSLVYLDQNTNTEFKITACGEWYMYEDTKSYCSMKYNQVQNIVNKENVILLGTK